MHKKTYKSFFRSPVSAVKIITFLKNINYIQIEAIGSTDLLLEATGDSRYGGYKQLFFTTLSNYLDTPALTDSLILIDEYPSVEQRGSNTFCKVNDPRAAFIYALKWLIDTVGVDAHQLGFGLESKISATAQIANSAVIEKGVEIGAGSIISANAVIKTGTRIGENTVIRENAVIGSDGISLYRAVDNKLLKLPHVGGVSIGSNTEVGANSVVAGGILTPTFIGNNVVIGNLCNIGHGVEIEDDVWMSVGSLLGGHTKVKKKATLAMGVSVRDNLVIGEEASLGMGSVVVKNVETKHSMFGNPAKRMVGLKTGPKR